MDKFEFINFLEQRIELTPLHLACVDDIFENMRIVDNIEYPFSFQEMLERFELRFSTLFSQYSPNVQMQFRGIYLNDYHHRKDELLSELSQLISQY